VSRTVLIGANGQLGTDLAAVLAGPDLVALTRRDLDVTDPAAVERVLVALAPAVVVNTAAFHRVDDIEADPHLALAVNGAAVHHLARRCARQGARLVHFSTDYVFGGAGDGPFAEDAPPAPVNAYGVSKLAGEQLVRNADPRHLVVRTSGLYGVAGAGGKGGNFVETMLRLAREGKPIRVVDDQVLGPTYTADLADAVGRLLAADPPGGTYHLTNAGIGQSTCIGIGGDPIIGTNFIDALELFEEDADTRAVVMIGEIGGTDEQEAAEYVERKMKTPVVGFIAGQTAPPGRRMGHAGAIISGSEGTAAEKMEAFRKHGIPVARRPAEIVDLVRNALA